MTRPTRPVTIASGQTTSAAVAIGDGVPVGLQTPAALTGTAITFQGSCDDGATYAPLYDSSGSVVSITVSTSRLIAIEGLYFVPCTHIKLVSGSSEAADRALVLVMRREPFR
jgi:hypothetical protein